MKTTENLRRLVAKLKGDQGLERRKALLELRDYCLKQSDMTTGPGAPAYHIYREVAEHIGKLLKRDERYG